MKILCTLLALSVSALAQVIAPGLNATGRLNLKAQPLTIELPNSSTGTVLNKLAKTVTSGGVLQAQIVTTSAADQQAVEGCVIAGAGTTGNAIILVFGTGPCYFDGATTAGHTAVPSSTSAGALHDSGSTSNASPETIAVVGATDACGSPPCLIAGSLFMTPSLVAGSGPGGGGGGTPKGRPGTPDTSFQYDSSGVFAGAANLLRRSATSVAAGADAASGPTGAALSVQDFTTAAINEGVYVELDKAARTQSTLRGIDTQLYTSASSNITTVTGQTIIISNEGASAMGSATGLRVSLENVGGSTMTDEFGINVIGDSSSGVTNKHGLYIGTQSGASGVNSAIETELGAVTFGDVMTSANVKRGAGSPEGAVVGVVGDIYGRTDGATATSLYRKESGSSNTGWVAVANVTANQNLRTIGASFGSFESGATALSGSHTACVATYFAGTIQSVELIGDVSGSATVDVLTVAHGSWTGRASAASITAAAIPAISSASKYTDSTLTGWTTTLAAGTDVCFALTSPTTVAGVAIAVKVAAN